MPFKNECNTLYKVPTAETRFKNMFFKHVRGEDGSMSKRKIVH